ncbi:DNA-directed RNA polymerase II subunit RPB4 isoform X2 [Equus przewalskii]|uniref:DNA-directed RNA polymerase II subunit RPB4 isoform X2 n=1 Tax=Equus przewalskii TaxID=9798 RepID=A0ABM4L5D1_EQUPR
MLKALKEIPPYVFVVTYPAFHHREFLGSATWRLPAFPPVLSRAPESRFLIHSSPQRGSWGSERPSAWSQDDRHRAHRTTGGALVAPALPRPGLRLLADRQRPIRLSRPPSCPPAPGPAPATPLPQRGGRLGASASGGVGGGARRGDGGWRQRPAGWRRGGGRLTAHLSQSLEGRFEDEELQQILDDIQTKRSFQY